MLYCTIINFETFLVESFHNANQLVQLEAGAGLSTDLSHLRPADILVQDWDRGKPVAFDISTLNSNVLFAVVATAGAASEAAELRKHTTNDTKCTELVRSSSGGVLRGMGQGGSALFS